MVTKDNIMKVASTIGKYTDKLIGEGQDVTDAEIKSNQLVTKIIDDSIAINQKIENATKLTPTPTTPS